MTPAPEKAPRRSYRKVLMLVAAIDWGVYGYPETFVVDADGRIAFKHIGPLTPEAR